MVRRSVVYIILAALLTGSLVSLNIGYHNNHRKYAGQQVINLCAGGYIPASSISTTINGGGPCLNGRPYILKNDEWLYDLSLVLIGVIIGSAATLAIQKSQKSPKKRSKRNSK